MTNWERHGWARRNGAKRDRTLTSLGRATRTGKNNWKGESARHRFAVTKARNEDRFAQPIDGFGAEALTGGMFIRQDRVLDLPIDVYIQGHGGDARTSHHMAGIVNSLEFWIARNKSKLGRDKIFALFQVALLLIEKNAQVRFPTDDGKADRPRETHADMQVFVNRRLELCLAGPVHQLFTKQVGIGCPAICFPNVAIA